MLTKIREKTQGVFASVILISICVLFGLWGIQNYLGKGGEEPIASVGKRDFFQRDVNRAYEQFRQNLQGMMVDEANLKAQALEKLIKDEVLLQNVHAEGLEVADTSARDFIESLPYFQADGKFDDGRYRSMLSSQKMSSIEFSSRIKNALIMDQFQRGILDSDFSTKYDIESFFKIQNQQRDIDYLIVDNKKKSSESPTAEQISTYYQQHQDDYKTPEQVSVEYVELSLDNIAKNITATDDQLKNFYEEQKDQFSIPERRKISHILFAVNDKNDEKSALEKALKAKDQLSNGKDFAVLASEISDDQLTAKNGGDLGLFNAGTMEKSFEEAVSTLKLGDVSSPVKSSFGYHLIKVTELVPAEVKSFDKIKEDVIKAYQKVQAENLFYESGERLAELSYEHPDNLKNVSDALGLAVNTTGFFSRLKGEGIAVEDKVRSMAFTDEVLQGNNSSPIEIGADRVVVLRLLNRKEATVRELKEVESEIVDVLLTDQARLQAVETAKLIKTRLQSGESIQAIAAEYKLQIKTVSGLTRINEDIPMPLNDAVFRAAKPIASKPTVFIVDLSDSGQAIVSLNKVVEGVITEEDKKKMDLATKNIARAIGQTEFDALLNDLQTKIGVKVRSGK